jgi:hypothetical protein
VLPSGRDTVRGGRVLTLVFVGHAAAKRKWPVLPVSAMAVEHRGKDGLERVEGPVIDKQEGDTNTCLVFLCVLLSSGSPRRQQGSAGVAVSERLQTMRSLFMFWMLGHPP